jgi:dihydroorotase
MLVGKMSLGNDDILAENLLQNCTSWLSNCYLILFASYIGQAIVSAITSGSKRFFLGTDSAPHDRRKKECACGCAGIYNSPVALSLYAKVFEEVTLLL